MNVLYLVNQNIFNVKSGGGQCAKRNYDSVREILNDTDVLYTCIISPEFMHVEEKERELHIPGLVGNLQSVIAALFGYKCYKRKYNKKILKYIEQIKPDLIYIDTSKMGNLAKKIKIKSEGRVICFFHNVESDYSLNLVRNRGKQYLLSYLASLQNEKNAIKYADKLIALTVRDSNRINQLYGRTPDSIIPISFKDKFDSDKCNINADNGLLFIGSLFPPNYDSIKWFIDKVMSQLPEQKLTIVGKDFEQKKAELECTNVKVVGSVDDLEEFYYTYPVMVMPIQYGAGMKVKMAEAMMYNKIVLATDEALEGYEIDGNRGIFRCNTAEEFINTINNIQRGNIKICPESREVFLKRYENGIIENQFRELIKL